MVENQSGIELVHHLAETWIEREARRIVDDLHSEIERALRDAGLVGVDREGDGQFVAELFEHRHQPADFLFLRDRRGPGLGGLGADVDEVSALLLEFHRAGVSLVRIEKRAAVGKRIRRHVDHTHDEGAIA